MMNGQEEDAMATATVPAPEATREREQRHCPECGSSYACSSSWRPKICPACLGRRTAQGHARRKDGMPTVGPIIPHAEIEPDPEPIPNELNRELATMRGMATGLEELDDAARARVMAWIIARYGEQSPWQP